MEWQYLANTCPPSVRDYSLFAMEIEEENGINYQKSQCGQHRVHVCLIKEGVSYLAQAG